MEDEVLAKVIAAIRKKPYLRRTELYRWLRERHATLTSELAEFQPSWRTVAEQLAAAGIKNARGGLVSADSIRKTWACVCRDVESDLLMRRTGLGSRKVQTSHLPRSWRPA